MDRPKSLQISGHKITVEFVDAFEDPGTSGIYDQMLRHISVLNNKDWQASLFHEAMHAALDIGGVSQALGEGLEEAVVHCLENALKKFFVCQPKKQRKKPVKAEQNQASQNNQANTAK